MEKSTILIRRAADAWVDRARRYSVIVDGDEVGKLEHGAEKAFDVAPGEREVTLKLDWVRSKSVKAILSPGQTIAMRCEAPSFVRLPLALTVGRGNYIKLDIEES